MTEYYVAKTGNNAWNGLYATSQGGSNGPWLTVQYGSTKIAGGDHLNIRTGTYNEEVDIFNGLVGTSANPTIIQAYNGETAVIDGAGVTVSYGGAIWLKNNVKYMEITGLEIKNALYAGIMVHAVTVDATDIRIDNCYIHDTSESAIYAYSEGYPSSIYVRRLTFTSNTATNIHLSHTAQEAISILGVQGFDVSYNTLTNFKKEGIDIKSGSSDGVVHHNKIDNTISDTTENGHSHMCIYVDPYTRLNNNIQVYQNSCSGDSGPGISVGPEDPSGELRNVTFFDNIVNLSTRAGFNLYRGFDCSTQTNNMHHWTNVTISGNTFYSRANQAIVRILPYNTSVTSLVVANNIICGLAYYAFSFQLMTQPDLAGHVTLTNNIYYRYNGTVHNNYNGSDDPAGGWGANYTTADPGFVSTATPDFHLLATSTAIAHANTTFAAYFDYDGNVRTGIPDIGAFEYGLGSSDIFPLVFPFRFTGDTATYFTTILSERFGDIDTRSKSLKSTRTLSETIHPGGTCSSSSFISSVLGNARWQLNDVRLPDTNVTARKISIPWSNQSFNVYGQKAVVNNIGRLVQPITVALNLSGSTRYDTESNIRNELENSKCVYLKARGGDYIYETYNAALIDPQSFAVEDSGPLLKCRLNGFIDEQTIATGNCVEGWTASVGTPTLLSDSRFGTKCVRANIGNMTYIPIKAFDTTKIDDICLWIKCDTASSALTTCQLFAYSGSDYYGWNLSFEAGEWTYIECDLYNPEIASGQTLYNIDRIKYVIAPTDPTKYVYVSWIFVD